MSKRHLSLGIEISLDSTQQQLRPELCQARSAQSSASKQRSRRDCAWSRGSAVDLWTCGPVPHRSGRQGLEMVLLQVINLLSDWVWSRRLQPHGMQARRVLSTPACREAGGRWDTVRRFQRGTLRTMNWEGGLGTVTMVCASQENSPGSQARIARVLVDSTNSTVTSRVIPAMNYVMTRIEAGKFCLFEIAQLAVRVSSK